MAKKAHQAKQVVVIKVIYESVHIVDIKRKFYLPGNEEKKLLS